MTYKEAELFKKGSPQASFYQKILEESAQFRVDYKNRKSIVKAKEMPWENSPQGLIKHIVNQKMNTREFVIEMYMQFLPPGRFSGKHRHMAEEVFYVLEGRGYDLHWDVKFDCADTYIWDWEKEPKKFEWEEGEFVYIPPYTMHQHFNANADKPARFITATNSLVKALGLNWFEQIENAPEYTEKQ